MISSTSAKIEAGRISISPDWFEMVDLFAALRGHVQAYPHQRSGRVGFRGTDSTCHAFSRTTRSSLKFYATSFPTRSSLPRTEKCGFPLISYSRLGDFFVADTGIGIAPEHQGALFQDFVQVDSPIKRFRGTGLGLALSKRLAELLGGSVAVQSELGRGSTSSAIIPIHFPPDKLPSPEEVQMATKSED